MSSDSAYSPAQLAEYLSYIGLPPSFHPSANPVLDLAYLTTLFTHQLTTVPYENLSIHYSPDHAINLEPQALFAKIVAARRGRGGYCMENSILFNHMLRALGFDVYTAGVRRRTRSPNGVPYGDYSGWVHLVNIVSLEDGAKYALDAGFGGDGPTMPLPLVEGVVHHNAIGTQEVRLVHNFTHNQRRVAGDGAHKMWIYQYRNGVDKEWNAFYAFYEVEFIEADFEVMSFYTSKSPDVGQHDTPLAIRFLRGEGDGDKGRITGKVMLSGADVKRNVTGRTELVKTCVSEEERVEVLRELFGIEFTEKEREGIKGWASELGKTVA
ncbi:arylamine N-acetyltransferase 2 [Bombardia bombarda]|uniref:Arylamine N-acetyltransferase 2 n=1 Tax=Bombardia bombarda TaxID=252184 RepID=A0AA40CFU6_9PEZI|nr:arylamine N-acetyltransferase 2 [Bombardia bombarda]